VEADRASLDCHKHPLTESNPFCRFPLRFNLRSTAV
jgi:hypothetical protein